VVASPSQLTTLSIDAWRAARATLSLQLFFPARLLIRQRRSHAPRYMVMPVTGPSMFNYQGEAMNKLLAAIVASTFAFGTVSAFAAERAKPEELTQEQRADMRTRADQLTRARATGTEQAQPKAQTTAKKTKSVKKTSKTTVKKVQPKS
jgi:isopentenyl diphosphate isomerase/L-lactate dehydrogenase-like FMN-dependent dehydrogenase